MTPAQLTALKSEITNDPIAIGYAGKDHETIAKLINNAARQVPDDGEKPTWKLFRCFEVSELTTAEADPIKFRRLQLLLGMPSINPDAARLRQHIVQVFGNPSTTLTRFDAWAKRSGTRAEELGLGRVTESDVADALLRT